MFHFKENSGERSRNEIRLLAGNTILTHDPSKHIILQQMMRAEEMVLSFELIFPSSFPSIARAGGQPEPPPRRALVFRLVEPGNALN